MTASTIANTGLLDLQGDLGISSADDTSLLLNDVGGVFAKSAGAATSLVNANTVAVSGSSILVDSGILRFSRSVDLADEAIVSGTGDVDLATADLDNKCNVSTGCITRTNHIHGDV